MTTFFETLVFFIVLFNCSSCVSAPKDSLQALGSQALKAKEGLEIDIKPIPMDTEDKK